ncbi:MAG: amphi-Trp domain-containing protein [Haloarculaceae archaeon]
MSDHVEFPDDRDADQRTVTDGFFEREVQLSRAETAAFLRDLADQVERESRLTISTADWEIPFELGEPIEVEVEFTGGRRDELEIEVEFTEPSGGSDLSVR